MSLGIHSVERTIGDRVLRIETGKLGKQAAGSAIVTYADTVVMVAAVTGPPRPGIDFFPLTVDYREKTYAAGKFPGGFFKREARPTQKEILTMRMIDRPIRPLFPEGFKDEVLIQAMVLSTDQQNDPDILAMIGASAALAVSQMPFEGPVSACRIGYVDDKLVLNPTLSQMEYSTVEMVLAGHMDAINMIEVGAAEVPESVLLEGAELGRKATVEICEMILELQEKAGKPKVWTPPPSTDNLMDELRNKYAARLRTARSVPGKQDRHNAVSEVYDAAKAEYFPEDEDTDELSWTVVRELLDRIEGEIVAEMVITEGKRADGRGTEDIRELICEVQLLPRVHGSALFQRGETQALCVATLGTGRDEQIVDGLSEEYSKKFMLHYNFPPFCTGEVRRVGFTSRREIGHGNLAEKALQSVLPTPEKFPYTIRLVSEILESNGSSSMASVCAGCMALMDAGVPIKQPVAGISIGAFEHGDKRALIVDILGEEDHFGEMDFKVTGTQRGVTAVQVDLKGRGISLDQIEEAMEAARKARLTILKKMLSVLPAPRDDTSEFAPRLLTIKIDPEKIGKVIGPGGKQIKLMEAETGANIEIGDDGTIVVSCLQMEGAERALEMIEAVTAEVKIGKIYTGRVSSIKDFGAFVELMPGQDGLCHISELDTDYVKSASDVVKVGETVRVKVIAIDDQGRIKLSRKAVCLEEAAAQ
ncbi:MAG: polyribonucleotide nucleotidyltransferase [Phycisphaerales bacterium]|nr:MAG: polyribonucleotide nucleotidyltransferase [Phycisphaerales bacterium]